jgi:hypothetical protein
MEGLTMTAAEKVQKDSAALKQLFGWLFGLGVFLIFSEIAYLPLKTIFLSLGTDALGSAAGQLGETVVTALPALALLGAVWQARRLFSSFASGQILSAEAGKALTRLGDLLVVSTVLWFFFGPATDRQEPVFGAYLSATIMLGCIGLAIRLVGRVVDLAAVIKVDHDQIV